MDLHAQINTQLRPIKTPSRRLLNIHYLPNWRILKPRKVIISHKQLTPTG